MVYLGASNTTALEIHNTLFGSQSTGGSAFHKQWMSLFAAIGINNKQNVVEVNLANAGCDNSKFSAVPDWYSNDYCHVLELVQT